MFIIFKECQQILDLQNLSVLYAVQQWWYEVRAGIEESEGTTLTSGPVLQRQVRCHYSPLWISPGFCDFCCLVRISPSSESSPASLAFVSRSSSWAWVSICMQPESFGSISAEKLPWVARLERELLIKPSSLEVGQPGACRLVHRETL